MFLSGGDNHELILVKTSNSDDIGCPMLNALDDIDIDLLISFEIKHIQFVFPYFQICKEAPHHNGFDNIIENRKSVTELPPEKKNTIKYVDRLYDDIWNNLHR